MKKIFSAILICIMTIFVSSCGSTKTKEAITKSTVSTQGKTFDNINLNFK